MINWFKNLFSGQKTFIKMAVDSLEMAVPFLAIEIDKVKKQFNGMDSIGQAQWVVDRVQLYLRKQFKLEE